jgi:hypothetical protein
MVERGGFKKKRVNPPIGAIKDRWIGGFGGKIKSQTSIQPQASKLVDWEVTASLTLAVSNGRLPPQLCTIDSFLQVPATLIESVRL